jgi:hypothetical protein
VSYYQLAPILELIQEFAMLDKPVLSLNDVGTNSSQSALDVRPEFGTKCRGNGLGFPLVGRHFGECTMAPSHATKPARNLV